MADDRRFRATERVAAKEVGGELVLLDLEEASFFVARGTGPRVWDLVEGGASIEEVVHAVSVRYGQNEDEVRADVEAFVSDLVERSFLVEVKPE
jgi:4-aminobutyrate aminotransferase-like enzyme